jgi:hypothetical protein
MSFNTLSNHQTVVGAETSQNRVSVGNTCLSVTKVPPDYVVHIPPILGVHPVTASRGETFFPERKASECEREIGHSPRDDHTETNVTTYETECGAAPVRCLLTVQCMPNDHKREKTLSEFSAFPDVAPSKTRVPTLSH